MQSFEFHRPKTVAEAVEALKSADEGKLLAGGQSLLPVMKLDMAAPSDLVSLRDIEELKGIREAGGAVVIGAASTHAQVAGSEVVKNKLPALAALAEQIGDPQVRNRGTLGGSVAHADPAADYPAALVALGATIETDRRELKADDFFTGLFETALEEDEVVTAVSFPVPEKAAYSKFPNPASRYAIAGVMVAKGPAGVRVAVTGAGPCVFRVEAMEKALASNWGAAALDGISVPADDLQSDADADAEFRAHLVGVMAKRAVEATE